MTNAISGCLRGRSMPTEENEKDDEDVDDDDEEPSLSINAMTHTQIRTKQLNT